MANFPIMDRAETLPNSHHSGTRFIKAAGIDALEYRVYHGRMAHESDTGRGIRGLRLRAGLTQRKLAERTGIAQPNIAAYESGRRTPNGATLDRIRRAIGPRPSELLTNHRARVADIVQRNHGRRLWIFGSTATEHDQPGSDLDLLVEFEPGATLLDEAALSLELEELLGIHVDVISLGGLKGPVGAEIRGSARPWAA